MEYFGIERPHLCLQEIIDKQQDTCGVLSRSNHYAGNFWATDCHYIATQLFRLDSTKHKAYTVAEHWIGSGQQGLPEVHHIIPGGLVRHPYRQWIRPEYYRNETFG